MSCSAFLKALFIGGFVFQVVGVGLVVKEILGDYRAARAIMEKDAEPLPRTALYGVKAGGRPGGAVGEMLERGDSFRRFYAERMEGGLRDRIVGVVLFVIGAIVVLAADLISVGC